MSPLFGPQMCWYGSVVLWIKGFEWWFPVWDERSDTTTKGSVDHSDFNDETVFESNVTVILFSPHVNSVMGNDTCDQMVDVLNVTPTDLEKTILDTANSMIEKGIIRKPRKQKKPKEPAAETGAGDAEGRFIISFYNPHIN